MSSPMSIPTLTRSGSKTRPLVSPASSFPSRGGFYRTHSQSENPQFQRSYSSSRHGGIHEPLLQQEAGSRSQRKQEGWYHGEDAERGAVQAAGPELLPVPQKLTVWQEVRRQCWLAGPMVCVNLLQYSITVVSVAFVGHLGELELASASIANSLAGVLGYYVLVCTFSTPFSVRLWRLGLL